MSLESEELLIDCSMFLSSEMVLNGIFVFDSTSDEMCGLAECGMTECGMTECGTPESGRPAMVSSASDTGDICS